MLVNLLSLEATWHGSVGMAQVGQNPAPLEFDPCYALRQSRVGLAYYATHIFSSFSHNRVVVGTTTTCMHEEVDEVRREGNKKRKKRWMTYVFNSYVGM